MEGPCLIIFLFFVIAAIAVAAAWAHGRARQQAMRQLAARRGWEFHPDGLGRSSFQNDSFLVRLLAGQGVPGPKYEPFGVFNRGDSQKAFNTILGHVETRLGDQRCACRIVCGDYRYSTGSGKNRSTHTFSYLLVELPIGKIPETIIRPRNFFDGLGALFGMDGIRFESAPFNDAFTVHGDDKRFAYDLCDQGMMSFLMRTRPPMIEVEGHRLCVCGGSGAWRPEEFERHLAWLDDFLAAWPRHVVDALIRAGGGRGHA